MQLLVILGCAVLSQAERRPIYGFPTHRLEQEPPVKLNLPYPYNIYQHPSTICDEETCLKCHQEFEGSILETNCHLQCGKCALCSQIKAEGTEEEFLKCKNMCVEGIIGCTNTCLRLQDKCLACLPECEKN